MTECNELLILKYTEKVSTKILKQLNKQKERNGISVNKGDIRAELDCWKCRIMSRRQGYFWSHNFHFPRPPTVRTRAEALGPRSCRQSNQGTTRSLSKVESNCLRQQRWARHVRRHVVGSWSVGPTLSEGRNFRQAMKRERMRWRVGCLGLRLNPHSLSPPLYGPHTFRFSPFFFFFFPPIKTLKSGMFQVPTAFFNQPPRIFFLLFSIFLFYFSFCWCCDSLKLFGDFGSYSHFYCYNAIPIYF